MITRNNAQADDIDSRDRVNLPGNDDELLRILLDGIKDFAIFAMDTDGRVATWNAGAERLKGYCAAEILGKDFSCFYAREDIDAGKPRRALETARRDGRYEEQGWRVRKDGSRFMANVVITALRDPAGSVVGFAKVTRDMTDRQETEHKLAMNEEQLGFALRSNQIGTWDLDLQSHIVHRSLSHDQIFGYQTLLPTWSYEMFLDHVLAEDRTEVDRLVQAAIASQSEWNFDCRIRRVDGVIRHILAAGYQVRNSAGIPVRLHGLVQDITERKHSAEQFRLAIEAAPTGMLMMDSAGAIVLVNAQIEKMFGYPRAELLGERVERLVPERFRAHHPDLRKGFFGDPKTRAMGAGRELYGLRKDGTEVPIEIGLNPLRTSEGDFVLSSIADITERQRANEQFRLAIDAAPTGMLLMDSAGAIVLVNAQIEKMFGYPRAELLGQRIEMLVPERFRVHHPDFRKTFFLDPKTRAMGVGRELYGLRKDGTEVPIEIGLNPLRASEGEFVLSSIVDISQRRAMDRMRNDFISTISHELRTPLTAISGSLGLLHSGAMGALPEKAALMVRIAYQNSGRLVRIINDILDMGKIEAGKIDLQMVSVQIAELIQRSVEANSSYAEKYQVRFLFDQAHASGQVLVDPDRLMQVLTNLLSNAAKYSPPGADVLIRVRPDAKTLRVEVQDSGPGIPEEFRDRIFEKFAQADSSASRRFEGTGLGLSIARKLIEAMGGTIGFSTVVGQGTSFYFDLPRTDAAPVALPETQLSETGVHRTLLSMAAIEAPGTNADVPRILHVDGNADLIGVTRATLAGRAEVVPAHTLRDAERLLGEGSFAVVVLDQSLPDGSGLSLVDRIPAIVGHSLPIVILSAADVPHEMRQKVAAVLVKSRVSAAKVATTILSCLPQPCP